MHLDKAFAIQHLRDAGRNEHVQKALRELPDKIDREQHAQLLMNLGIDPGALFATYASKALGDPPAAPR